MELMMYSNKLKIKQKCHYCILNILTVSKIYNFSNLSFVIILTDNK